MKTKTTFRLGTALVVASLLGACAQTGQPAMSANQRNAAIGAAAGAVAARAFDGNAVKGALAGAAAGALACDSAGMGCY